MQKDKRMFRAHSTSAVLWNLSSQGLPRPLWGHIKAVPQERRSPHNAPYLHPMRSPSSEQHLLITSHCVLEKQSPAASEPVKTVGMDGSPAGWNPASPSPIRGRLLYTAPWLPLPPATEPHSPSLSNDSPYSIFKSKASIHTEPSKKMPLPVANHGSSLYIKWNSGG